MSKKRQPVMVGERFGRLVVQSRDGVFCVCQCDCGVVHRARGHNLRAGETKSCGCLKREVDVARNRTHGQCGSPEHVSWCKMLMRCRNHNNERWGAYGGRGIQVCERWLEFKNFLEDMGQRPTSRHSIDRIDVNGNYEPGNCRWATRHEQQRNRRDTRMIEFCGEVLSIAEAAERAGLHRLLVNDRLRMGWGVERALTEPPRNHCRRRTAGGVACPQL